VSRNGWPICTIGFGKDADEGSLRKIAKDTGCTYSPASTFDVVGKFQQLGAYVKGESSMVAVSDLLHIDGKLIYDFVVSNGAEDLTVQPTWQGSLLNTILISPDGRTIAADQLANDGGRYVQGDTYQMLKIADPQPGHWRIEVSWADTPPIPEQVSILVTEKTDVFSQVLAFEPQYSIGETVRINVETKELAGIKRTPLENTSIKVSVQKPGAQMIRLIQAQSSNWAMYKDVKNDITRELELFDDGMHDDYKPGDGIFGNSFRETDKQGSYLVRAEVNGKMRDGRSVDKSLLASFQVGPITRNKVTNSQTLQYVARASQHIDDASPYSEEIFNQPMDEIEEMQGVDPLDEIDGINMQGEDPMDSIEQLLNN